MAGSYLIWLHHPHAEMFSDSDEETSDDLVTGTFCETCETNGTAYSIFDDHGLRLPNPYIKYCKEWCHPATEFHFTPPKVDANLNCTDLMREYKTYKFKVQAIRALLAYYLPVRDLSAMVADFFFPPSVPQVNERDMRMALGLPRTIRNLVREYWEPVRPFYAFVGHMARFM
jgi:hypothetical protein